MPLMVPARTLTLADVLVTLGVPDAIDGQPVAAVVILELADGRVVLAESAGLSPADRLGLVTAATLRAEHEIL